MRKQVVLWAFIVLVLALAWQGLHLLHLGDVIRRIHGR
jgi:hypothetical protein